MGFWLNAPASEGALQPEEVGQRITAEAGQTLLAEAIREQVAPVVFRIDHQQLDVFHG